MISMLIGLGIALGFLVAYTGVGILIARRRAVSVYRRTYANNRRAYKYTSDEKIVEYADRETHSELFNVALFWPFWLIGMAFTGLGNAGSNLLMGPVYERQYRAEKLRADAARWEEVAASATGERREMAEELVRILREQAKEVEL
jgi:hypothetical protein